MDKKLKKLSILTDELDNVPSSNNALIPYESDDTSIISIKGIENAKMEIRKRRDDLRMLEVQAMTLYNNLTEIQNEIN